MAKRGAATQRTRAAQKVETAAIRVIVTGRERSPIISLALPLNAPLLNGSLARRSYGRT
jgi:hypothetical protein